jgi:hypothetical protein
MLTCRLCNCNCDPSDLIGGVCDDCREQEEREQEKQREMSRIMTAEFKQMRLEDFVNERSDKKL